MTGVFTTAYAAPIGYYKTILRCDASYIEVNENFIKQTIRNRCIIATSNGPLTLSIPLLGRRNNMPVSEMMICYKQSWQRQHIRSMETAYHSSPFFEFYHDDLKALYAIQPNSLSLDKQLFMHSREPTYLSLPTKNKLLIYLMI
jgi:D-serine dehydratase